MKVTELNRDQLIELKQAMLTERNDAAGEGTSYGELADVDELITDAEVYEAYADTEFSTDDFFASAGQDEPDHAESTTACAIELGGRRISIEDVAAKFGIDMSKAGDIALCRVIHSGVLKAMTNLCDTVYPGIDIEVEAGGPSDIVVRVERPKGEALRTLLYGSGESYIAYTDRDLDNDGPGTDIIIASGDPGNEVIVKRENQYARFDGLIMED